MLFTMDVLDAVFLTVFGLLMVILGSLYLGAKVQAWFRRRAR